MQSAENSDLEIHCCLCNKRFTSTSTMLHHLMFQHASEDICLALMALSAQRSHSPFLLNTAQFNDFFQQYPQLKSIVNFEFDLPGGQSASFNLPNMSPFLSSHYFSCNPSSIPCSPALGMIADCNFNPLLQTPPQSYTHYSLNLTPIKSAASEVFQRVVPSPEKMSSPKARAPRSRISSVNSVQNLSQQSTDTLILDVVNLSQEMAQEAANEDMDDVRKFKCDQCKNSYKLKAHLTRHKKSVHSTERPYKCQFCAKAFKVKELLNQHLRSHRDRLPFDCGFCSKKFFMASDLKEHTKKEHEYHPYMCGHCDSTFLFFGKLEKHAKRLHKCNVSQCQMCTGLKKKGLRNTRKFAFSVLNFICDICKKGNVDKNRLRIHLKRAHNIG
ncbi:zinc finger protein 8-like [Neocloeon triangulifer]|uniref:zinc finger protein 8-like n=1 Tax=Neocloeon triangulifer TaxID=2078957 RepID=UPI00286F80F9|nr:zinc finger protein 8-like [Neocloeon triangulifer]